MNILAQIEKLVDDKFHQNMMDAAVVVEKTPVSFFVKTAALFAGTIILVLLFRQWKISRVEKKKSQDK
jgi:Ca2+/Na+ antiporter